MIWYLKNVLRPISLFQWCSMWLRYAIYLYNINIKNFNLNIVIIYHRIIFNIVANTVVLSVQVYVLGNFRKISLVQMAYLSTWSTQKNVDFLLLFDNCWVKCVYWGENQNSKSLFEYSKDLQKKILLCDFFTYFIFHFLSTERIFEKMNSIGQLYAKIS